MNMEMQTRIARCACGQLSLETAADPIRISVCHCLDCKRRSGSAFAIQARFPACSVTISGASKTFVRVGQAVTTFHFCPTCGSTLYFVSEHAADQIAVAVGAFADPAFPSPTVSVYEDRMHAWVVMPDGIEHWQ
jgi:hypothetical protein